MSDTRRMLHPRANAHRLRGHLKASVGYAMGLRENYLKYHPEDEDEIEEVESVIAQLQSLQAQAKWLEERSDNRFRLFK